MLHDLNGMENAGDELLAIIWKLELDIGDFNKGLDAVEKKHEFNKSVTSKQVLSKEKDSLDKEIPKLW